MTWIITAPENIMGHVVVVEVPLLLRPCVCQKALKLPSEQKKEICSCIPMSSSPHIPPPPTNFFFWVFEAASADGCRVLASL